MSHLPTTSITAAVAIVAVALFTIFFPYITHDNVAVHIEDKERIVDLEESYYLIYTSEGVYKNTDSWAYFKFDSSDLYGALRRGNYYQCSYFGWRISLFSVYPNLLSCEAIKTN